MLLKSIWIVLVSCAVAAIVFLGGVGVSVVPLTVEKEVPDSQLPK
ncbi:MAG: hypothetical protein NTX76_00180 [Alphaproteobacteria bacterium]|nr:hypothetical protein [Alphaproteobacteria bacterium]